MSELGNMLDCINLDAEFKKLQQRLEEAELCIDACYNIDTKFIDTEKECDEKEWLKAIFKNIEEYKAKYKGIE